MILKTRVTNWVEKADNPKQAKPFKPEDLDVVYERPLEELCTLYGSCNTWPDEKTGIFIKLETTNSTKTRCGLELFQIAPEV